MPFTEKAFPKNKTIIPKFNEDSWNDRLFMRIFMKMEREIKRERVGERKKER